MGSTYLQLTNRLLRRVNEVELTNTNFISTRGIHSVAKDCVKDAVNEINQQKWQWPFLAVQHTQVLQVGEAEYGWPADFQSVDWSSFQIVKNSVNPSNRHLKVINRVDWYNQIRDTDEDDGASAIPDYVFRTHGTGFGLSPIPDKEYTLEFRYYKNPVELITHDNECDIPSVYDNVILWGSLYHMNLFRENVEGTQIADAKFKDGIKNMYLALVGSMTEGVTDTRINFGGQPIVSEKYR